VKENKYAKFAYLLPIGIVMLLPAFLISFVHQGNMIDKVFFFVALLGYLFIIIGTVVAYKNTTPINKHYIKKAPFKLKMRLNGAAFV
jgi:vacuolar-type H+-ATPase subunit I/STV1